MQIWNELDHGKKWYKRTVGRSIQTNVETCRELWGGRSDYQGKYISDYVFQLFYWRGSGRPICLDGSRSVLLCEGQISAQALWTGFLAGFLLAFRWNTMPSFGPYTSKKCRAVGESLKDSFGNKQLFSNSAFEGRLKSGDLADQTKGSCSKTRVFKYIKCSCTKGD